MNQRTTPAEVLMCPPDYFGIYYEINPWMHVERPADTARACIQWQELVALYRRFGVRVHQLRPVAGLPDMVFTANAGVVQDGRVVLSRFRYPQRQPEEPLLADWFARHGYDTRTLPEGHYFEGAGDAKFYAGLLLGGFPFRSDPVALAEAAALLDTPALPLELCDPRFYHLDTCFAVLRPDLVLYYPPAFAPAAQQAIARLPGDKLVVSDEDALDFACNCVVLGDTVVLHRATPALRAALREQGLQVQQVNVGEFLKAGGSTGCLTLLL